MPTSLLDVDLIEIGGTFTFDAGYFYLWSIAIAGI
jgi:hypothetical protein